jgi:hypothetical protein
MLRSFQHVKRSARPCGPASSFVSAARIGELRPSGVISCKSDLGDLEWHQESISPRNLASYCAIGVFLEAMWSSIRYEMVREIPTGIRAVGRAQVTQIDSD